MKHDSNIDSEQPEFTGERYLPHVSGNIELEHIHRYLCAQQLVNDKIVLDIACGEGYGSSILSKTAAKVIGVDISENTIAGAIPRYGSQRISFKVGDCSKIPLPSNSVDCVISFETIEHHDQHEEMMAEVLRVLKGDGFLLISSPDKKEYSDVPQYTNEYHVKELYKAEFENLLDSHFENVQLFGQKVIFGSGIFSEGQATPFVSYCPDTRLASDGLLAPIYHLALASNGKLPDLSNSFFVQPVQESEAVKSIARLASVREQSVVKLRGDLQKQEFRVSDALALVGIRDKRITELDTEIEHLFQSNSWKLTGLLRGFRRKLITKPRIAIQKMTKLFLATIWKALPENLFIKKSIRSVRRHYKYSRESRRTRMVSVLFLLMAIGKKLFRSNGVAYIFLAFLFRPVAKWAYRREMANKLMVHVGVNRPRRKWGSVKELYFEKHDSPKVSILIPVYNHWKTTYACLESIANHSGSSVSYEILIFDDCSNDKTSRFLEKIHGIRMVRNKTNLGFLRNCNEGAKHARGELLLLLNNDVLVHDGWLNALVSRAESDSTIGLVGAKLVGADGVLQEAGGIVWQDGSGWNYGRGDSPTLPEYNFYKETDYCSGACILTPRHLWESLGGFDDRFAPAYYEDTDLAFAIRQAGYKVVYEPLAVVTHLEGISHGTDTSSGMKKYQIENQKKFVEKWSSVLQKEQKRGPSDLFLAHSRTSSDMPVVFIADYQVPCWSEEAGGRLTWMYIQMFVEMGYRVIFWPHNLHGAEPWTAGMEDLGVQVLHGPEYRDIDSWLKENGHFIDFAYLHRPEVARTLLPFVREHTAAKIVYQCHDLHHVREQRKWELEGNSGVSPESARVKKVEDAVVSAAHTIHTPSTDERDIIRKAFPGKAVHDVPVFFYDEPKKPKEGIHPPSLIFVGGFGHLPNEDAVLWFMEEVFPSILENTPEVVFHIVGGGASERISSLQSKNVVIHGRITDEELDNLYSTVSIAVAPLRFGAGVKGKVIEALAQGLAVVTTEIGAEGIPLEESPLFIDSDPVAFSKCVSKLLDDDELVLKASRGSSAFIEKNYSSARVREILQRDFPSVNGSVTS